MNHFIKGIDTGIIPDNNALLFAFKNYEILLVKTSKNNFTLPTIKNFENSPVQFNSLEFIGKFHDKNCFNINFNTNIELPEYFTFENIRSTFNIFDFDHFQVIGYAYHLGRWDIDTKYCGKCGNKTERAPDEKAKKCTSCDHIIYPKISPAIIVAILKNDDILLASNNRFKKNLYSILAGFVDPGESLEECVHREVMEEVGIRIKNIRYYDSQPWPFPDSLMVGFFADYYSGQIKVNDEELSDAAWFNRKNMPELPASFSIARRMINSYVEKNYPQ